jgi:1-aminocyclopropane-1-carboxylate deaminase/D-cysteine desulfhydrase-like pyridoxal-dependent ACC family enzyme
MEAREVKPSPQIHLFRQYPELQEKTPYVSLAQFPTPVQKLASLGRELQLENLYIKRDDLCSNLYGSNKVRKLEFFLGDALGKGLKEVVTLGFAGSNHSLATSIYANSLGMSCNSFLLPQKNAHYVRRNLLASYHFKANLFYSRNFIVLLSGILGKMIKSRITHGIYPKFIPGGGSNPEGLLGYVNAAFELQEQISNGELPKPDYIYVPLGSTGTMLGLMLGFKALSLDIKVVGVRVIEKYLAPEKQMVSLFNTTAKYIHKKTSDFPLLTITKKELFIKDNYLGRGYASFTEKGVQAAQMVQKHVGVVLNGSYTAKAFAALMDDAYNQKLRGKVVLFWNTYNSNDLSRYTATADYHQLPSKFHCCFENKVQTLDKSGMDR